MRISIARMQLSYPGVYLPLLLTLSLPLWTEVPFAEKYTTSKELQSAREREREREKKRERERERNRERERLNVIFIF